MKRLALALCLALVLPGFALPVHAVQPDEILSDPALEERARGLSGGLRCLVCRNESIDDSDAPLARDLRLLVRERLVEGDSDDEVIDFIVARYGEYVLLQPTTGGANLLLWAAGPIMLLLAGGIGLGYVRRRSQATPDPQSELDAQEQARLDEIMRG